MSSSAILGILVGKPTIRGTRISVELILDEIANGHSADDLLHWFPQLRESNIRAALAFAHQSMMSKGHNQG